MRGGTSIDTKICACCLEEKELIKFYSYEKKSETKGVYTYYQPTCKICVSKKATNWGKENKERKRESDRKYDKSLKGKESMKQRNIRHRKVNRKLWIKENKDKIYRYVKNHRTHEITNEEWMECKTYFNFCCAYCGMSIDEQKKLYKQDLHKEHVDCDGKNDLSNCVPSCKECNSQKGNLKFEEWYNGDNIKFNEERLHRINKWLNDDYKNFK